MRWFVLLLAGFLTTAVVADGGCPNGGKPYDMLRAGQMLLFKYNEQQSQRSNGPAKATINFFSRKPGQSRKFVRRITLELPVCELEHPEADDTECRGVAARLHFKYGRRGPEDRAYDIYDPSHTISLRIWIRDVERSIWALKFGDHYMDNFELLSDLLYVEEKLCIETHGIDPPEIISIASGNASSHSQKHIHI